MILISWIISIFNTVLPLLKVLWANWGIHFLVTASLACETVLTVLGLRRKYLTSNVARFILWASYLLLSFVVKIALGKLTVVRIEDPENPRYNVELQGLLAPLLLMQLGYPDGITAYSVEDNVLGLRQIMNVGATVVFVVWILIRCWDGSSPVSWLYIPLFIAGFIKSALWVWALKSVYDENSSVNAEDIPEVATKEVMKASVQLGTFPHHQKLRNAELILKAYFRFDCLNPHLVNWPYHHQFVSYDWISIESYSPDRTFTLNEIELSFMFDVLYTRSPVLYTKIGTAGRFIGFFCLVSAFCRYAVIFKNSFLIDMYITYTYALLMAVTSLELYQISTLAFSDWAVVRMGMSLDVPLIRRLLPFLADWCMKKKRWSRSMGQLNLFKHCHTHEEWPKPVGTLLDWFSKKEIFSCYWLPSRLPMPRLLRTLVLRKMAELEKKRNFLPFTERGKWTLEIHGIQEKQGLSGSITPLFAKSIIIWHIATETLHSLENKNSDACQGSKVLSEYMVYLLALHPYMLSLSTADITLQHTCHTLRLFLRYRDRDEAISTLSSADGDSPLPVEPIKVRRITRDWHVLLEVQKLVLDLKRMDNKWEIISSIWVEMLCYAAFNCRVYDHAKLLRRGGELITHVWLLLLHKTDKYPYEDIELDSSSPESPSSEDPSCLRRIFGKRNAKTSHDRAK